MPMIVAIPYFFIEGIAFMLVSWWLGIGYALLLLFGLFIAGIMLAALEMARISKRLTAGQPAPVATAGDLGLLAAGAVGIAMPGFVTTILGLLLIFAPTRAVVRRLLANKLREKIEAMGVRSFSATHAYRQKATYGTFVDADATASSPAPSFEIDEEALKRWTENLRPEDFGPDASGNADR
ncbi:FxsA family protein [Corynebacterium sp. HS2168-gen11]|uniref:FxsA family protein n=1 Tax=Corynebacterium sp. HS2168-gen11 TaxID=2974027 RepID=UPI00216ADFEE|nr:FxsA family protein [Corynebacterium sp. HS2168-gen11]MCS4535067.1 FxsA family protein [Corynebacterium sp. HS2168-gen11]